MINRRAITTTALLLALPPVMASPAVAQGGTSPFDIPTSNGSQKITNGGTFQLLLPAVPSTTIDSRQSMTIQNNNTGNTDLCYVLFGKNLNVVAGTTSLTSTLVLTNSTLLGNQTLLGAQAAVVLSQYGSYQRYYPRLPSEAVYVTCATTGDTVYADTQ